MTCENSQVAPEPSVCCESCLSLRKEVAELSTALSELRRKLDIKTTELNAVEKSLEDKNKLISRLRRKKKAQQRKRTRNRVRSKVLDGFYFNGALRQNQCETETREEELIDIKETEEDEIVIEQTEVEEEEILVDGQRHTLSSSLSKIHTCYCKVCGEKFRNKIELSSHEKLTGHEFRFVCRYCNQVFKQKIQMCRHEEQVHGLGSIFECRLCERTFKNEYSWKRHESNLKLHRKLSRPIQECYVCGKRLKRRNKWAMAQHLKTHNKVLLDSQLELISTPDNVENEKDVFPLKKELN